MRSAVLNFVVAEAYIARKAELLRSSAYYRWNAERISVWDAESLAAAVQIALQVQCDSPTANMLKAFAPQLMRLWVIDSRRARL